MSNCKHYDYYETLNDAIKTFGRINQEIVAIEELSELQKEISKHLRGQFNRDHLVEEMADVEIILDQLRMMFDVRIEETEEVKTAKVKRLNERIEKCMQDTIAFFAENI